MMMTLPAREGGSAMNFIVGKLWGDFGESRENQMLRRG
jgi:hypothetical protein